jgi:hypothetical protein
MWRDLMIYLRDVSNIRVVNNFEKNCRREVELLF